MPACADTRLALFHRNTSLARLYSFAVDPAWRGRGSRTPGLHGCDRSHRRGPAARWPICASRYVPTTRPPSRFYRVPRLHRPFSPSISAYYDDAMDALRMEKPLVANLPVDRARVPYYAQTLEFTCGPAALMMAMKALRPDTGAGPVPGDRTVARVDDDLHDRRPRRLRTDRLGVGRHAARIRCRPVRVGDSVNMFVESVRSPMKREVIRISSRRHSSTRSRREGIVPAQ